MNLIERIKKSRGLSFFVVAVIYLLAAVLGAAVYLLLPFDWWLSLLIADIAATVFVFLFGLLFHNASVYDPYWSVQPVVILFAFSFSAAWTTVRILLFLAVLYWGVRLTANWAYTFHGLAFEDWRYRMLREKNGAFYPVVNFFGIHLIPTLVVYGCILPAVWAFRYDAASNAGSVVFFVVSVGAATLQLFADIQMQRFRNRKTGGFIRDGLWKYARHPNYLGEILMWWGVALSVVSVFPNAFWLCAGALANTALFLAVSIPMAEGRQAQKEGFPAYRDETRLLLPVRK